MIVVLMGGEGNQMFAYAFGESVAKKRGIPVQYHQQGLGAGSIRAYSLEAFNIRRDIQFVDRHVARNGRPTFTEPVFRYYPEVYTTSTETLFDGCWQSEKYFDVPLVREAFKLRNEPSDATLRVADAIVAAGPKSAFLHIRRTDYLLGPNPEFHGAPSQNYYEEAYRRISAACDGAKFFVFSDDPEWCRANLRPEYTVVDHNKMGMNGQRGQEHEDIWLMSLCRNAVVANSSFSWWGAWLGDEQPNRMVFAPKRWFKTPKMSDQDIVPDRWTKLGN